VFVVPLYDFKDARHFIVIILFARIKEVKFFCWCYQVLQVRSHTGLWTLGVQTSNLLKGETLPHIL